MCRDLGILDVDLVLRSLPAWKLSEWEAFLRIEQQAHQQQTLEARAAAGLNA